MGCFLDTDAVYEPQRQHTGVVRIIDNKVTYYYHTDCWQRDDVSFVPTGTTTGPMSAAFESQRNHTSFFIKGGDGYLHLWFAQPGWLHDGVSFQAAGQVTGDISAFFNPKSNHIAVFFKGGDGKLHYYSLVNGAWNHEYLAFDTLGQVGHISACFDPHRYGAACFVVGGDGLLHCMRENTDGTWVDDVNQLVTAGPIYGEIAGLYEPLRENIACFVVNSTNHITYCYCPQDVWQYDATTFTETCTGGVSAVFSPKRNHSEVVFHSTGNQLQYYFVENGTWTKENDLCKNVNSSQFVHMVYEDVREHSAICFLGLDDKIHYLFGKPI